VLEVLDPGQLSSIQDGGRRGLAHLGVAPCGAADRVAHAVANLLCASAPDAPVVEMTWEGATFAVLESGRIGLAGADMGAHVPEEGRRFQPGAAYHVRAGTTLAFGAARDGARTYLALEGGIRVPRVLGSASTDLVAGFGGLGGRALAVGDRLHPGRPSASRPVHARERAWPGPGPASGIGRSDGVLGVAVVPGPHAEAIPAPAMDVLLGHPWRVSWRSDRAGIRLEGQALDRTGLAEPVSLPMRPGAVQAPGEGPIILGPDGPTVGGYPVPLCIALADLPLVGQLRPGDELRFELIDAAAAVERLRALETALVVAARVLA
jgi:biotin-dependent carboxylase-like uncharacterized protein